jgi:hypothetical protein
MPTKTAFIEGRFYSIGIGDGNAAGFGTWMSLPA